jgi:adenylate kinase
MILFFGAAGSGKSTQAQMMADEGNWSWISMGQLLRDTTDPEVHEFQQKGELVPTEKVNKVLAQALNKEAPAETLIIDGYPRQLDQAEWLIENCKKLNIKIEMAVSFDVGVEELLKRMKLRGRIDDTLDSINKRLSIYSKEIDSIMGLLSKNGVKIVHIDGVGFVDDIHERVLVEFENRKLI